MKTYNETTGGRGAGFAANWVGGMSAGRGARRRIMAILRTSCLVLGVDRRGLGLGGLGFAGRARAAGAAAALLTGALSVSTIALPETALAQVYCVNSAGVVVNPAGTDGTGAVVCGPGAVAAGTNAVAVGNNSRGTGNNSVAVGNGATATLGGAIAIGNNSNAANVGSTNIAIGTSAVARGVSAGLGDQLAIGASAQATGQDSTAIGGQTSATATNTLAIGNNGTTASATGATAFGSGSIASGTNSMAAGNAAQATAANATALGAGANASTANSVALGVNSTTGAANTGTFAITGGTAAGTSPAGVVSVGSAGNVRQIQNVGAGVLSATSTDAVNGSQLNATNSVVTTHTTQIGNIGGSIASGLGGTSSYNAATGTLTTALTVGGTTYTNVNAALTAVNTAATAGINIQANGGAAQNIAPGGTINYVSGTNAAVTRTGSTITVGVVNNPTFSGTVTANGGLAVGAGQTVNMGGNRVANVAAGAVNAASTDAVNGAQLFATNSQVTQNAADITALGGRVTTVEGDVSDLDDRLTTAEGDIDTNTTDIADLDTRVTTAEGNITANTADIAALQQDALQWNPTLGAYDASHGSGSPQVITNVAPGALNATSTDAVNGSQLFATNQDVAQNAADIATVEGDVSDLDTRLTTAEGDIDTNTTDIADLDTRVTDAEGDIAANTTGIAALQQDALQWNATLGAYDASHGSGAPQLISNVAAGVAATDAANVGQVNTLGGATATALGGTSSYDPATQSLTTGLAVGGTTYGNVQDALNALGGVAGAGFNVTDGTSSANIGGGGTVTFAPADANLTVAQTGADDDGRVEIGLADDIDVASVTAGGAVLDATGLNVGGTTLTAGGLAVAGGPSVTTAGIDAANTVIANVAPGAVTAASTDAVNGSQLFATNQDVAQNATDIAGIDGRVTTVEGDVSDLDTRLATAEGDIDTNTTDIADLDGRVTTAEGNIATNTTNIAALQQDALQWNPALGAYDASHGAGAPQVITNVAAGALNATSTDAVNGSQLFATNEQVAQNTTDITNLTNNVSNGAAGPVQRTGAGNQLALVAPGGTGAAPGNPQVLTNVAAGAVNATSTDAVNGSQLDATNTQVAQNTTDIANLDNRVTNVEGDVTNLTNNIANGAAGTVQRTGTPGELALVGPGGTGAAPGDAQVLTNVAAGEISAASTDAVNGAQLNATNQQVTQTASNVENLGNGTAAGLGGGSSYDAATGTLTTSLTVAGNTYTNVNEALNAVNQAAGAGWNVQADGGPATNIPSNGTLNVAGGSNTVVTLSGNRLEVAVTDSPTFAGTVTANGGLNVGQNASVNMGGNVVQNVGAGAVNATSTDAVNGSQLYAVQQQTANSVQYDSADRSTVTFNGGGDPTRLRNVAAGVAPTDAVNVQQLNDGLASTLSAANAYTDTRIAAFQFDLTALRRDSNAGIAGALAAAALPQAFEAGRSMISGGAATYGGQSAFALGLSRVMNDGRTVVRAGVSYDTRERVGANVGVGYQF